MFHIAVIVSLAGGPLAPHPAGFVDAIGPATVQRSSITYPAR
jgi:hypothetical protein